MESWLHFGLPFVLLFLPCHQNKWQWKSSFAWILSAGGFKQLPLALLHLPLCFSSSIELCCAGSWGEGHGQGAVGMPGSGEQLVSDGSAPGSAHPAQHGILRSLFSLQGLLSWGRFLMASCLSGTNVNSRPLQLRFLMHIQQGKHRQLTGYRTSSQPDMYCKCLNYVCCEGQLVVGSAHCSSLVLKVPLLQGSCTSPRCAV